MSYSGLKINDAADADTGRQIFSITANENSSPGELTIRPSFVTSLGGTSF